MSLVELYSLVILYGFFKWCSLVVRLSHSIKDGAMHNSRFIYSFMQSFIKEIFLTIFCYIDGWVVVFLLYVEEVLLILWVNVECADSSLQFNCHIHQSTTVKKKCRFSDTFMGILDLYMPRFSYLDKMSHIIIFGGQPQNS